MSDVFVIPSYAVTIPIHVYAISYLYNRNLINRLYSIKIGFKRKWEPSRKGLTVVDYKLPFLFVKRTLFKLTAFILTACHTDFSLLSSDWVKEYFNAPCQPHFNVNLYNLELNNVPFLHILAHLMRHFQFQWVQGAWRTPNLFTV